MKKLIFCSLLTLLAIGIAATAPYNVAQAQFDMAPAEQGAPKVTSAMGVASVFYKWTQQLPPFGVWARHVPEAKTRRNKFEWQIYLRDKPADLRTAYDLRMYNEPINVKFVGVLSAYSRKTEGYVVKNFSEDTYFPYSFAGKEYAVIPQGLADKQWLPVSPMASEQIERIIKRPGVRKVLLIISLEPLGASKDKPMVMEDGKKRYLIGAKVSNLGIYSCDRDGECKALWNEGTKQYRENEKNELYNLKQ